MNKCPNVTEQDLINLSKLAQQQKDIRATKIENRVLKQTHDKKLAESLWPITKKLEEVDNTTEEIGEVSKTNSENENTQELVSLEDNLDDSEVETGYRKYALKIYLRVRNLVKWWEKP